MRTRDKKVLLRVVNGAIKLLSKKNGWTKGRMTKNEGQSHCLVGAILRASGEDFRHDEVGEYCSIGINRANKIATLMAEAGKLQTISGWGPSWDDLIDFNDSRSKKEPVINFLKKARKLLQS